MVCQRRRVARRQAFTPYAAAVLVTAFSISATPTKEQREKLAQAIGTTERRVQVWFQNRRQRTSSLGAGEAGQGPEADETDLTSTPDASHAQIVLSDPYQIVSIAKKEGLRQLGLMNGDDVTAAAPCDEVGIKEGHVKEDMRMEAFTTLFPPFEARATPRTHPSVHACACMPFRPSERERHIPSALAQVMWASGDWLDFCGFQTAEIVGQTLKIIQGPETDADTIVALMDAVARVDSINVRLTNYTRHGSAYPKALERTSTHVCDLSLYSHAD